MTRLAFCALDLAQLAELHNPVHVVLVGQQGSARADGAPSLGNGQHQVCHCHLSMLKSTCVLYKLSNSNGCPLLILYLTRLAFSALDLAQLAELHNPVHVVQVGQQGSARVDGALSSGSGQHQVCHCNHSMVMSACVLHKLSSNNGCLLLIMCTTVLD